MGISLGENGKIFLSAKDSPVVEVFPFEEDALRKFIRDGKLDVSDLGSFAAFASCCAETEIAQQNANLPSLLFLVRDCKDNIKFSDIDVLLPRSRSVKRVCGADENTSGSCAHFRVNHSAFLGNFYLSFGDSLKDTR